MPDVNGLAGNGWQLVRGITEEEADEISHRNIEVVAAGSAAGLAGGMSQIQLI
jgi:hypothetical protein